MSGRKLSEVQCSLQATEEVQGEIVSICKHVAEVCSELQLLSKPASALTTVLTQLKQRWADVLGRMSNLKEAVARRARRGEQHGYDAEYSQAEIVLGEFSETKSAFRKLSEKADNDLSIARNDLRKDISMLQDKLDSKKMFTVLGMQSASEFAASLGLGHDYLLEVTDLLAMAKSALANNDVTTAQSMYEKANDVWQNRLYGLKALHDNCADVRSFAQATADFFAEKQGFQVEIDFRQTPFRLSAKKAGSEYSCEFGSLLEQGGGAAQIVWDTPHGIGCIEVINDLNRHLLECGFLHRFTQAKEHPRKAIRTRLPERKRGEQP
jgi:hypothetical protein